MSVAASGHFTGPMAPLLGAAKLMVGVSRDTFFNFYLRCFVWDNHPQNQKKCAVRKGEKSCSTQRGSGVISVSSLILEGKTHNSYYILNIIIYISYNSCWRHVYSETMRAEGRRSQSIGRLSMANRCCFSILLAPGRPRSSAWPTHCPQLSVQLPGRDMRDVLAATAISWASPPESLSIHRQQPQKEQHRRARKIIQQRR